MLVSAHNDTHRHVRESRELIMTLKSDLEAEQTKVEKLENNIQTQALEHSCFVGNWKRKSNPLPRIGMLILIPPSS
ncbi:hypothetical protein JCGZ_18137 [Jatropha curcas]|uniref:Uncharacterized protein n=1 Tax=Jatropha curcas TaxID=180498 RepID=A0A067KEV5_JATCU|nr:hypothetical protein JCGZ_18137 [Jatropha curcas]